jgi:hypothetical protein
MTLLQRNDELFRGLLREFLDLFRFHFRSPVRGFGSLTRSRGTKEPRLQENEEDNSRSRAEGNRRDASPRAAQRVLRTGYGCPRSDSV